VVFGAHENQVLRLTKLLVGEAVLAARGVLLDSVNVCDLAVPCLILAKQRSGAGFVRHVEGTAVARVKK